ncbi:hypothetical protein ACQ4PT_058371 [Festuca glaucescens]
MVNTTLVKSFFTMPHGDTYILLRIEFLVAVSTLLFLGMSVLDIFRGHFHSSSIKAMLSIVDSVSDSLVLYLMGAMQTAPFKNQLFPVWAIVLVSFRYSSDFITGYGITDKQGRRFTEWRNVIKLLGVAFLTKTRGSMFAYPLWSLWCLQMVRGYYRLQSRDLAYNSVWHGKSSQVVSEYMRTDTKFENFKLQDCKADTMEGYRYLVYGETDRHLVFKKPRYVLQIDSNPRETRDKARAQARAKRKAKREAKAKGTADQAQRETGPAKSHAKALPDSLITLDKIWQCDGALLNPDSTHGDKFKDLSLAFSLSRLLRCRLENVLLHKDSTPITKNLVLLRIIQEETKRAFGVMELEMSFLNDYFNTRYPMVFWLGLNSLHLSFIMSAATFGVACWLSVDIRRVYKTPKDEVSHVIHGVNIDMIITWVFMFFMVFKEIWEMASYYLSDWASLLLASAYVRWKENLLFRKCRMDKFIRSCFTSKIASRKWHGVLDQFAFFQSYADSPILWNLMHIVSTGAIPKKDDGAKLGDHIDIPECVRAAILVTLRSMDLTRAHLLDVIQSLLAESRERYRWACFELPTSTHIILVWHIATSLCEIRFAADRDVNLRSPGFPLNALLYLTSLCRCCCCAPQPYLVNENILHSDLKIKYIVANSLSRYCAYLLVSKPDLVPDSYLAPNMIFQETVKDARRILKGCDSLEKIYKTLMDEVDTVDQDTSNSEVNINIVQQGVKLAKELMCEDEESCWEILAGVWADLLIHIAPSWNAAAHKDCIESGGEFITHIWALLVHCGIEKSMLWPVEGLPRSNAPRASLNKNSGNNSVHLAQDQRQAACAGERDGKQGMETANGPSFVNGDGHLIRGMQNLGSTCYFSAVLQSLLALSELRVRILEQNSPTGLLHLELKKLFQEVACGANSTGVGGTLVTENLFSVMSSRYRDFKIGAMEDSNNLLGSLLDGLENEEPTMVESLFRGQVVKHVSGKECEHTSVTTQVLDLCLAIPPKEHVSVEDCLDLYATGEVDDWYCPTCSAVTAPGNVSAVTNDTAVDGDLTQQSDNVSHQPVQASSHPAEHRTSTPNQHKEKQPMLGEDASQMEQSHTEHKEEKKIYKAANENFRITKAPPILTIQLKRFKYVSRRRSYKLEKHVSFQDVLNIKKFMDPRCAGDDDCSYRLVAVIVHEGKELFEGHNYCYVRASSIGHERGVTHSWFCADDANVRKVYIEEVLQCQAYILFYQRVDQWMVKMNLCTHSYKINGVVTCKFA